MSQHPTNQISPPLSVPVQGWFRTPVAAAMLTSALGYIMGRNSIQFLDYIDRSFMTHTTRNFSIVLLITVAIPHFIMLSYPILVHRKKILMLKALFFALAITLVSYIFIIKISYLYATDTITHIGTCVMYLVIGAIHGYSAFSLFELGRRACAVKQGVIGTIPLILFASLFLIPNVRNILRSDTALESILMIFRILALMFIVVYPAWQIERILKQHAQQNATPPLT